MMRPHLLAYFLMDVTSCAAIFFNPNHQIHPIENIKAVKSRLKILTIFCTQINIMTSYRPTDRNLLAFGNYPIGRRSEKSAESDRLIYLDSKF